MDIWYVHGAGASERSFVWLRQQLPDHTAHFFTYDTTQPISAIIERCSNEVGNHAVLIGHSLGGIIAAICACRSKVSKLVTLCTPFGGLRQADLISFFRSDPLIHDLRPYSKVLTNLRDAYLPTPHLSIVGTQGLPFLLESNDGVVTVASQMALHGPRYEAFPLNHFEMLLSDDVAALISDFLS